MVWYGVVWCGVVWCGVVWCDVVWCGALGCGAVRCGAVWCGLVRYSICYGVDLQLLKYIISDAYDVLKMLEMLSDSKFVVLLFYSLRCTIVSL